MFDRALAPLNRLALKHVGAQWVDYVASNTMTDFNRWFNGFIWTYDLKALVIEVIDEAPGVKTFVLRPNQHWRGMRAGQYVEVTLPIDGREVRRHYSPTPLPRGRMAITVRAIDGGQASTWMHRRLRPGMQIKMGHPQGRFVVDGMRDGHDAQGQGTREGRSKVLLLCAGTGITPCRAIVNDVLRQAPAQRPDVQLVAQFRSARDVIFKPDLTRWRTAGVKVSTALSGESGGPGGRLNAQSLLKACPDIRSREIFLCGPAGFMAQMLDHLAALEVDIARVRTERFVTADAPPCAPQGFDAAGVEVSFQHLNTCITLRAEDQGKTLLELARDHGVHVESGCGQGMCGTCRLTLHDGQASGNVLGKVVYLCTSYPASARVVLDA